MAKGFIKSMKSELKKVIWPTKEQLIKNTMMVVVLVLIVSAVVLGIDLVLEFADKHLWNFIQEIIK